MLSDFGSLKENMIIMYIVINSEPYRNFKAGLGVQGQRKQDFQYGFHSRQQSLC